MSNSEAVGGGAGAISFDASGAIVDAYSILSGTHVRFFTRRTLVDLFEASGYRVRAIDAVVLPPSPLGAERLARLRAFPGASPDLDTSEFHAVAEADG